MRALALALAAASLGAAGDVPQWVHDAARQPAAVWPVRLAAVELFREHNLTVEAEGRYLLRERGAIRILQRSRNLPRAFCEYNPRAGRVREFEGWLLPPSGRPVVLGKNAVVDASFSDESTFEEARYRVLSPGADPEPGSVFAWESVVEEKSIFAETEYRFQGSAPVLVSRFVLTMPPAWEIRAVMFNHESLAPSTSGNTYTWELHDLPWIEPEKDSPEIDGLAPRLGVNYLPPAGAATAFRPAKDWAAVSAIESSFYEPPVEVTEAVKVKAQDLTRGAATELEKIRAIAAFVQKTNYVAVAINVARGGGLTPHAAEETLIRNYGDCKDKATLMRALLKAVGIGSYAVSIHSGDRQFVRPEWPSGGQFNHAIVAVRVSPGTDLPTILNHPRLGLLLIFDPTSQVTPLGNLPKDEQGSYALLVAGSGGDLVRMPVLPPKLNRVVSVVTGDMLPDGSLSAHVTEQRFGQSASRLRYTSRYEEHDALKRWLERSVARGLGGSALGSIEPVDRMTDDQFQLSWDMQVKQFGQVLQGRLLTLAPGSLSFGGAGYSFPAKARSSPVELSPERFEDSVAIRAPAQFQSDEIPDAVHLVSPYGSYSASWRADGNTIRFEQSLEVNDVVAPASEYARVRDFFESVESSRSAAVVLVKR